VATVHAGLSDRNEAFKQLEQALQERDWLLIELKVARNLDSLHSDPRFADLLRRVGLPQ
jgi:hypothetical protein